jgi:hypothetical protein
MPLVSFFSLLLLPLIGFFSLLLLPLIGFFSLLLLPLIGFFSLLLLLHQTRSLLRLRCQRARSLLLPAFDVLVDQGENVFNQHAHRCFGISPLPCDPAWRIKRKTYGKSVEIAAPSCLLCASQMRKLALGRLLRK